MGRTNTSSAARVIGGTTGLVFALLMMGCPKPPPPPPPAPPPPPPPAPAPVTLESLGQDMKADARVTFAAGLEVEADQESLGRAVVGLADALAKGDDKKLDDLLDAKARELLSELRNSGAWQDQTKQIENVRVVFLGGGVNFAQSASAVAATALDPAVVRATLDAMKSSLPPDVADQMKDFASKLDTPEGRKELAETFKTQLDAIKAAGSTNDAATAQLEAMIKMLEGSPDAAPSVTSGSSIGTLIAIQDPRGTYLTGWRAIQVGEKWSFAGAPASPEVRPRAEAFDGIGALGFEGMIIVKKAADEKKTDDAKDPNADTGEGDSSGDGGGGGNPDAPRRKNTPAGPVTIPGGGGGGGGGGG